MNGFIWLTSAKRSVSAFHVLRSDSMPPFGTLVDSRLCFKLHSFVILEIFTRQGMWAIWLPFPQRHYTTSPNTSIPERLSVVISCADVKLRRMQVYAFRQQPAENVSETVFSFLAEYVRLHQLPKRHHNCLLCVWSKLQLSSGPAGFRYVCAELQVFFNGDGRGDLLGGGWDDRLPLP